MYKIKVTHKGITKYLIGGAKHSISATPDFNAATHYDDMSAAKNVRDDALDPAYRFSNVTLIRC